MNQQVSAYWTMSVSKTTNTLLGQTRIGKATLIENLCHRIIKGISKVPTRVSKHPSVSGDQQEDAKMDLHWE